MHSFFLTNGYIMCEINIPSTRRNIKLSNRVIYTRVVRHAYFEDGVLLRLETPEGNRRVFHYEIVQFSIITKHRLFEFEWDIETVEHDKASLVILYERSHTEPVIQCTYLLLRRTWFIGLSIEDVQFWTKYHSFSFSQHNLYITPMEQ